MLRQAHVVVEGRLVGAAKEAQDLADRVKEVQRDLQRFLHGDERTQCERENDAMMEAGGHLIGAGQELKRAVEVLNMWCDDDGMVNVGQSWVNVDDLEQMAGDLDLYGMEAMHFEAEYDDEQYEID